MPLFMGLFLLNLFAYNLRGYITRVYTFPLTNITRLCIYPNFTMLDASMPHAPHAPVSYDSHLSLAKKEK